MEYTVNKLGQLAGISARTLRYYDEIGILKPARINSSVYRIYGHSEVRKKYGDEAVNKSNQKVKGMSQEEHDKVTKLASHVMDTLHAAFKTGDPAGELAQKAADLHRQWLCFYWDSGIPKGCSPCLYEGGKVVCKKRLMKINRFFCVCICDLMGFEVICIK